MQIGDNHELSGAAQRPQLGEGVRLEDAYSARIGLRIEVIIKDDIERLPSAAVDACGLPAGTFKTIVEEIGDTGKAKIDQTLSKLPPDFPATVVGSISDGAKRRIDTLASA
jgi:hypothetical protein